MGTVHKLHSSASGVTAGEAIAAYLATLDHPEAKGTKRMYSSILNRLASHFGEAADLDSITAEDLAAWFSGQWGSKTPATWNVALECIRSACRYWAGQGWLTADPADRLRRRTVAPDRTRALSRDQVEKLLKDQRHSLRDRTLWRMLYSSAARSAEVLRLDIADLDRANKRARVTRKGGARDVIVWDTATADLITRYLNSRGKPKAGPLFVTGRRGKGHNVGRILPGDLDPGGYARLSYRQAEDAFKAASDGATLHQLRHSALTHAAEDGWNTSQLLSKSGHESVRTLAKYARVSPEALQRKMEAADAAKRR